MRPFVKWAGGKTQLLDELIHRMPSEYGKYYEVMVGGGALFFALNPENAYISDANFDLINLYQVIRSRPYALIEDMQTHINSKEYFYELRKKDRTEEYNSWSSVKKASRILFLNRTCFNGLYRVNKNGQFNVPYGKYINPYIPTLEHILSCSNVLTDATIAYQGFSGILNSVEEGDFVYLDPPYMPASDTAKFTEYTRGGFGVEQHARIRDFCRTLSERRVKFMLSNSDTASTRELYAEWNIDRVNATRSISARASGRRIVQEIIVRNY